MRTVKEVSRLTGVSVRTLHHYDAIGLLKPSMVTEAGYRLYDDAALSRLQTILLFRELQFPLKEIGAILDSPDFDPAEALSQQIRLLELQYKRMGELILFARQIKEKGVDNMNTDFDAFDKTELEQYKSEAKAKWGGTQAYREFEQRSASRTERDRTELATKLMTLLSEIGALRDRSPDDEAVLEKVAELQVFITENYYKCTNEILSGLGQMYISDARFRRNIDKAAGEGTAEFVSRAIAAYCANGAR